MEGLRSVVGRCETATADDGGESQRGKRDAVIRAHLKLGS